MEHPERKRAAGLALGVGAVAVVAYLSLSGRRVEADDVPAEAVGWYGAMSLYRNVALWAGKRAMSAEMNYWKAVQ